MVESNGSFDAVDIRGNGTVDLISVGANTPWRWWKSTVPFRARPLVDVATSWRKFSVTNNFNGRGIILCNLAGTERHLLNNTYIPFILLIVVTWFCRRGCQGGIHSDTVIPTKMCYLLSKDKTLISPCERPSQPLYLQPTLNPTYIALLLTYNATINPTAGNAWTAASAFEKHISSLRYHASFQKIGRHGAFVMALELETLHDLCWVHDPGKVVESVDGGGESAMNGNHVADNARILIELAAIHWD